MVWTDESAFFLSRLLPFWCWLRLHLDGPCTAYHDMSLFWLHLKKKSWGFPMEIFVLFPSLSCQQWDERNSWNPSTHVSIRYGYLNRGAYAISRTVHGFQEINFALRDTFTNLIDLHWQGERDCNGIIFHCTRKPSPIYDRNVSCTEHESWAIRIHHVTSKSKCPICRHGTISLVPLRLSIGFFFFLAASRWHRIHCLCQSIPTIFR